MSATSDIAAKKWARTIQDIQKKSYWVIGLLLLGFSAYFYYTSLNKPVAGVLWFIGGFLIVYYYWLKWFVLDRPYDPDFFTGSGACPDYLSVIPNNSGLYMPTSTTQYFCVDFVGVSRNGGIRKMNRKNVATEIADPAYRFSVDPEVDFATPAAKAAFVRRLQMAGLSYNSVGDSSLPTMNVYSNGAPAFGANSISNVVPFAPMGLTPMAGSGGAFTITPAVMKEMEAYAKANNISPGEPTNAQKQGIINHLIAKGMAPPGTTVDQLMTALMGGAPLNLTPAQIAAIQTAMEAYGKANPAPPIQPGGTLDMMTPITAVLNNSLIPRGLVPPGTSAIQLMQELMKQAQRDQQNAGVPPEFQIQQGRAM
jgi:hypothetical protein